MAESITVENEILGSVTDDASQAGGDAADLSEVMQETPVQETPAQETQQMPQTEPGWMKQRIQSAVNKQLAQAVSDAENRIRAEYEKQLAPLRDSIVEREAADLVSSGQIKNKEMALAYARMRRGMPVEAPATATAPAQQPRDDKGRFQATGNNDSAVQQRAATLAAQVKAIQSVGGPDVMKAYRENKDVQSRVASGEWDFTDVARSLTQPSPTPVRSTGGNGGVQTSTIASMTNEQFDRLNEALRRGRRFNP